MMGVVVSHTSWAATRRRDAGFCGRWSTFNRSI